MLVDWRDFDSFYLVKEPNHKEARDLFQLLFDVAPGKHKIEILTATVDAKSQLIQIVLDCSGRRRAILES